MKFRHISWWERIKWHEWSMLGALVVWFAFQLFGSDGIVWLLKQDATTAWVQALGSIAAVWAAVGIMRRQIAHEKDASIESWLQKMNMIQSSIFFTRMRADRVVRRVTLQGDDPEGLADLANRMTRLADAPMFEYPTTQSWYFVELLQDSFRQVYDNWTGWDPRDDGPRRARLDYLAGFIRQLHVTEVAMEDNAVEVFDLRLGTVMVALREGEIRLSGRMGWPKEYDDQDGDADGPA